MAQQSAQIIAAQAAILDWHNPALLVAYIAAGMTFVTSVLAFVGVIVSNRNATTRLRLQLDHDARKADREREMALRRDVYLPAAEAVLKAQSTLGRLNDLNALDAEIAKDFAAAMAAIGKTHVVASEETINHLMAYTAGIGRAFIRLSIQRVAMRLRKGEIASLDQVLNRITVCSFSDFRTNG